MKYTITLSQVKTGLESFQIYSSIADKSVSRLQAERDACKGSTDTPKGAMFGIGTTPKLKNGSSAKRPQTVRDDGVKGNKSRTSVAIARS